MTISEENDEKKEVEKDEDKIKDPSEIHAVVRPTGDDLIIGDLDGGYQVSPGLDVVSSSMLLTPPAPTLGDSPALTLPDLDSIIASTPMNIPKSYSSSLPTSHLTTVFVGECLILLIFCFPTLSPLKFLNKS